MNITNNYQCFEVNFFISQNKIFYSACALFQLLKNKIIRIKLLKLKSLLPLNLTNANDTSDKTYHS